MPNFDQPAQNKDVGQKPPAVPGESHEKSESLLHRLQDEMTQVPVEVAAAAGFIVGLSAKLPGTAGRAGKVAAAIFGTAVAADAVDRGIEGHRDTNTKAYENDAAFLTAMGSGILLPNMLRSKNAILEGKKAVQDAAESVGLITEKSLLGTERVTTNLQSLGLKSAAEAPLTARPGNVIDFGKYAGIYKKEGASKMITEEQIGKFPPETQAAIRKEIKDMTANGYDPEYLMLAHDGEVMLDRDAAVTGEEVKALRQMKKNRN
jgi:hypothetical protein